MSSVPPAPWSGPVPGSAGRPAAMASASLTWWIPSWAPSWVARSWTAYRDRLADLGYLGAALVFLVGLTVGTLDVLVLAGVPVVGALLLLRRRFPVAVAVVGLIASATFFGAPVAALTIFALAVRRRGAVLLVVCLAHWVVLVVAVSAILGPPQYGLSLLSAVGVGGSAAAGAFVGARRDLVDSLQQRAERAEAEQALRADQARLGERARIAQEMHDVLAHKISLVTLQAGGLEVRPDAGPAEVERIAGLIRGTAREALEELRGVLGVLRGADGSGAPSGDDLAPQPTLRDVPGLVEASSGAGVAVRLEWHVPDDLQVPDVMGRTAFRVAQEALTNLHKHAVGAAAVVRVVAAPGHHVEVVVENRRPPGRPVGPLVPGTGSGLAGLAERVQLAGGAFQAGTTESGFVVRAWIPWPATARGGRTDGDGGRAW